MTPDHDLREVAHAIRALIGSPVLEATPVMGSVANQDFLATLADGRTVFAKVGPQVELVAEAWALQNVETRAGVPVPRVLGYRAPDADWPACLLVLGKVAHDATPAIAACRQAGAGLRAVHRITVEGYGPLEVHGDPRTPDGVRGVFETWQAYLDSIVSGGDVLVDVGLLARERLTKIAALARETVDYSSDGVLLHGDIKEPHIFSTNGSLTALIDWGAASVGDPAWDLARASMMDPAIYDALAQGYGVDHDLESRLGTYRVLWNLTALTYEYQAGGDWFEAYQQRIETDLHA